MLPLALSLSAILVLEHLLSFVFRILIGLLATISPLAAPFAGSVAGADSDPSQEHSHAPMIVRSRPVIERLPLKVIQPIDLTATETGHLFVADRSGSIVFRIDPEHRADAVARQIADLSRVTAHRLGIYCLTSNGRSGSVIQLTETGHQSQPVYLNFAPAGLAVNEVGDLYIGNSDRAEIIRLRRSGDLWERQHVQVATAVRDVRAEKTGRVVALLENGSVVSLSDADNVRHEGWVPASTTRLAIHPQDGILAVGLEDTLQPCLYRLTQNRQQSVRYASLPEGTVAVAFDRLGNLASANPDLRAVTRVTSRFEVPCPHCGQRVPMILSPHAPVAPARRRSF